MAKNVFSGLNKKRRTLLGSASGIGQASVHAGNSPVEWVNLKDLNKPLTPSPLETAEAQRPESYGGDYEDQIRDLLDGILNREDFSYDMNADPLYRQYRDMYLSQGRSAMEDAMGQAAALTGGYMNSYALTAGAQAYQNYLSALDDKALSLYDRAYSRYTQNAQDARDRLSALQDYDDRAYSRYRDKVSDWQDERDYQYQKQQDAQDQANWQAQYDYTTRKWKKRKVKMYAP